MDASVRAAPVEAPILLFGMPRSGTTWIGKTFDSHPSTLYLHEPDSRVRMEPVPPIPLASRYAEYAEAVQDYCNALRETRSPSVLCKFPLFPKSYHPPGYGFLMRAAAYTSKLADRAGLPTAIPDPLAVRRRRAPSVVWKSIESLGCLPLLLGCLPRARAIHILRHPCGYIDSVRRGEASRRFGSQTAASDDWGYFTLLTESEPGMRHGLSLASLRAMSALERLAWRWVLTNEKSWYELKDEPRYHVVRYEALCESPEAGYQALFAFAGLKWTQRTQDFLGASTRGGDAYYSVFRDTAAAADGWRGRMTAEERAAIAAVVARSALAELYPDCAA